MMQTEKQLTASNFGIGILREMGIQNCVTYLIAHFVWKNRKTEFDIWFASLFSAETSGEMHLGPRAFQRYITAWSTTFTDNTKMTTLFTIYFGTKTECLSKNGRDIEQPWYKELFTIYWRAHVASSAIFFRLGWKIKTNLDVPRRRIPMWIRM